MKLIQPNASILIIHTLPDGTMLKHQGEFKMDQLHKLVGDGNMQVTFSSSQSDKVFGNGCETFISITATCNQDETSSMKVVMLLKDFIQSILSTAHSEALGEWKQNNELNKSLISG